MSASLSSDKNESNNTKDAQLNVPPPGPSPAAFPARRKKKFSVERVQENNENKPVTLPTIETNNDNVPPPGPSPAAFPKRKGRKDEPEKNETLKTEEKKTVDVPANDILTDNHDKGNVPPPGQAPAGFPKRKVAQKPPQTNEGTTPEVEKSEKESVPPPGPSVGAFPKRKPKPKLENEPEQTTVEVIPSASKTLDEPIVVQPTSITNIEGTRSSIESFSEINELWIYQKDTQEVSHRDGAQKQFLVKDSQKQQIFVAEEYSKHSLKLFNNAGKELISINRSRSFNFCLMPCFLENTKVSAPPGTLIGTIAQKRSPFTPTYILKDAHGDDLIKIEGSFRNPVSCKNKTEFNAVSLSGTQITCMRITEDEGQGNSIKFPAGLDVKQKELMLASWFLIKSIYSS